MTMNYVKDVNYIAESQEGLLGFFFFFFLTSYYIWFFFFHFFSEPFKNKFQGAIVTCHLQIFQNLSPRNKYILL